MVYYGVNGLGRINFVFEWRQSDFNIHSKFIREKDVAASDLA